MSPAENAAATSLELKLPRRKKQRKTDYERHQAAIARKRENHKEIKVFVKNPLKDLMVSLCQKENITQAQFIERLLESEFKNRSM